MKDITKQILLIVGSVVGGYMYANYENKKHQPKNDISGTIWVVKDENLKENIYLDLTITLEELVNKKEVIFDIKKQD